MIGELVIVRAGTLAKRWENGEKKPPWERAPGDVGTTLNEDTLAILVGIEHVKRDIRRYDFVSAYPRPRRFSVWTMLTMECLFMRKL